MDDQPRVMYRQAVQAALNGGLYMSDGRWRTRGLSHTPTTVARAEVEAAVRDGWVVVSADGMSCDATARARAWVAQ